MIQNKSKATNEDDDNESFDQYDLNSEVQSARSKQEVVLNEKKSSKGSSPTVAEMTEIITLKNILIQAQQEELDKLKNELVRGTSVYVLMNQKEKQEWDELKGIER